MTPPGRPDNEKERLKSLYMMDLLDTRDDERFERLARIARKLFSVPVAFISLLDHNRQWLLASQGFDIRETPRDVSFCGHAILQRGPFIVNDTRLDERFHDNPLVTGKPHIRFYAGYPVCLPDGAIAGTVCIIDSSPHNFSEADVSLLRDLALIVEDEFQVISMAMTDSLTGIPNRRGFYRSGERRINALQSNPEPFSIVYFDLDKFKPINDLWGHAEGDEVLKIFASHLCQHLGEHDIAGRLGGDEFAVLISRGSDTPAFLEKLQASLTDFNLRARRPYSISYSYGVRNSIAGRCTSLPEMMSESDQIMYSDKKRKKIGQLITK
ncbi:GGDEF domain-containing protein [Cronobacter sakazakii]|uniref:GGDEF domain-containing protein n=1 Tax=Cronobacter sakazakii TaxID=28141 RepID=UPI001559AEC6|nr:sensor domain-containing diguanylate cyclase [Cronobacter sakazakii]